MTAGRTIAIGDIHGCATALRTLLAALKLQSADTLVMLGDAIDRGPDSCDVIDQLISVDACCTLVPILGNHEQMLLDAYERKIPLHQWLMHGGAETLDSYGEGSTVSELPAHHIDFLYTWGDYHETAGHFFAHGNYLPRKKLPFQPWEEMRWLSLREFLPGPHVSGKTAILGHTSNRLGRIANHGHLICIDTYCHGGECLTALEPATGKVWQSDESGEVREGELPPVR